MSSVEASGTQTATLTTEHTVATITTQGVFQLNVDTTNLVNGETLVIKEKLKTLAGGASTILSEWSIQHLQGDPQFVSLPRASNIEIVYTLTQTGGTGRAFPWSITKL